MSTQQPQSLQQFIDNQKTQYATQKGIQASNDYIAIITPYVNQIISLQKQLKVAQEKIPKKQRVKIIQKGKKWLVFCWIPFPTILPSGGGVPGFTDMVDAFIIPEHFKNSTSVGEFIFALKDTEKKVTATTSTISSGVSKTLLNLIDATAYKPPTGKTARAVLKIATGNSFTGNVEVRASDTADTADGTVLITWSSIGSSISWTTKIVTIPAGKFLTVTHQTGSGSTGLVQAWIGEEK